MAGEEINYRRFFDINELAAIRMEDPPVFELRARLRVRSDQARLPGRPAHRPRGRPVRSGRLPAAAATAGRASCAPDAAAVTRRFYLVVEKILTDDEELPDWPVEGTTGYDFLVRVNGLFVDQRNERALNDVYERFARLKVPFDEIAYRGKQLVLRVSMAGELNVLGHRLNLFSERSRHYRDFTLNALTQAMREIIACFPVYRIVRERPRRGQRAGSSTRIEHAVREAKQPQSEPAGGGLRLRQRPAAEARRATSASRHATSTCGSSASSSRSPAR